MNGKLIRAMSAIISLIAAQIAVAQVDGAPPLPRHLIEQVGTLGRVDVARRMVWIENKPYKVSLKTQAYVGSRPMQDIRELIVGRELAFTVGAGGTLDALWMNLPAAEGGDQPKRGERR